MPLTYLKMLITSIISKWLSLLLQARGGWLCTNSSTRDGRGGLEMTPPPIGFLQRKMFLAYKSPHIMFLTGRYHLGDS